MNYVKIKKTNIYKVLVSDYNIYKAILSVNSYIFNPKLLNNEDLNLYYRIKDKFDYDLYFNKDSGLIEKIKRRINEIIKAPNYFKTKVYFKIKKLDKSSYRPIHICNLIDSIAIVSMLQILIFDMNINFGTKIKFSNLARTIPSYFYGNIPSKSPEKLFESWKVKYREYSENANNKYAEYGENEKYKYEVTLDLENFFPSVNPLLVYNFIIEKLEVKYSSDELELIKIIVYKLLFLRLDFEEIEKKEKSIEFFEKFYYADCKKEKMVDAKPITIQINGQSKPYYITPGSAAVIFFRKFNNDTSFRNI